jgi:hypothetical protein
MTQRRIAFRRGWLSLDDVPDERALSYPVARRVEGSLPVSGRRALDGARHAALRSANQTGGEYFVLLGAWAEPGPAGRFDVEVAVGHQGALRGSPETGWWYDGLQPEEAPTILERALAEAERVGYEGRVHFDRAVVHPVDIRRWAVQAAAGMLIQLLDPALDGKTDLELAAWATAWWDGRWSE